MDRVTSRDKAHYVDPVTGDQLSVMPTVPKAMMFDLTNGCNHACYFCNNPHQQRKISRMPRELGFRIMREAHETGVQEIGFYNTGDPFVSTDLEILAANHLPLRNERFSGICSSPFKRVHMTSEGYMTLCCVEYENYAAVEDLREMSFMDAWHSPRF